MKIKLVDKKLNPIYETTLDGHPPDGIYFTQPGYAEEFFTRLGISDGTATYRPGTTAEVKV